MYAIREFMIYLRSCNLGPGLFRAKFSRTPVRRKWFLVYSQVVCPQALPQNILPATFVLEQRKLTANVRVVAHQARFPDSPPATLRAWYRPQCDTRHRGP